MKKGFTLLEMVVVMMVVSILFLLTIPNITKVISSVDEKGCKALCKVVDSAILEFKLDYGEYPRSMNDLLNAGYISQEQMTCSNGNKIVIEDNQAVIK